MAEADQNRRPANRFITGNTVENHQQMGQKMDQMVNEMGLALNMPSQNKSTGL